VLSCGRLMYHGPCDGLEGWFSGLGFEYDASRHGVVSDWALDLVAVGSHKPRDFSGPLTVCARSEARALSVAFILHWMTSRGLVADEASAKALRRASRSGGGARRRSGGATSDGGVVVRVVPRGLSGPGSPSAGGAAAAVMAVRRDEYHARHSAGGRPQKWEAAAARPRWITKFLWLYSRELKMITRNPADVAGRTITFAWVAVSTGVFYYALPPDTAGTKLRVNMLLNSIAFFCVMPYISLGLYMADKKVYLADVSGKLIQPSAYYVAKVGRACQQRLQGPSSFMAVAKGYWLWGRGGVVWGHNFGGAPFHPQLCSRPLAYPPPPRWRQRCRSCSSAASASRSSSTGCRASATHRKRSCRAARCPP
jgi:hypothetical protein